MQRNHVLPLLAAIAVVTASLAAFAIARATPPEFHGTHLGSGIVAQDFTLEAAEHGRVSLSDFRGQAVLMFFGYTHCPDVCPLTMGKLRRAMELMGDRSRDVQVLLVSVDPEMDSPERMREFLLNFDPGFIGLTGTREELETVAGLYGAYMGEAPAPPAPAHDHGSHGGAGAHDAPEDPHAGHQLPPRLIDHTSQVFGIDRRGEFRLLWGSDMTAEQIAEDVRQLLRF
jgi:protein SCO1